MEMKKKGAGNLSYYFLSMITLSIPIFLANQYYIDDMGRSMKGFTGWSIDGRPLAEIMMQSLVIGVKMNDIFPLPLLLGCAFAAYSMREFHNSYLNSGISSMIVPLSILASPSTPEILSYRFDSLTIIFSIFISLLIISKKTGRNGLDFILGSACVVAIYSTYQPSINIFVICSIAEFLLSINSGKALKKCMQLAASRALQFVTGTVIYMKVILPASFSGVHSSSHPGLDVNNIITNLIKNSIEYCKFLDENFFFGKTWVFFFISFLVVSALAYTAITNNTHSIGIKKKIIILALSILISFISCFFTMGSLLFLDKSIVIFSRVYIGFGGLVFLSCLCFNLICARIDARKMLCISAVPLAYILVYTYSFGAASKAQWDYTSMMMSDIKNSSRGMSFDYFIFNGEYAKSPILINSEQRYPIFRFNIPNYFYNWVWPYKRFELEGMNLYRPPAKKLVMHAIKSMCESPVNKHERLYDLHLVENSLVVDFSKSCK